MLLSRQWYGYDFPGGGAELHETMADTLKREFWEETGFKVKPIKIVYTGSAFWYSIVKKKYWNCQLIYYTVKKISGKLSTAGFDKYEKKYAELAEWIDINKLNKIKFYNSIGDKQSIALIKKASKNYV